MSCTKSTPRKYLINHSMILNRHLDVALHPDAVEFLAQPRDLARLVGRARPPALVGASAPARRWPRQVVPPPSAAKLAPADPAICLSLLRRVDGFLVAPVDGFTLSPDTSSTPLRLLSPSGVSTEPGITSGLRARPPGRCRPGRCATPGLRAPASWQPSAPRLISTADSTQRWMKDGGHVTRLKSPRDSINLWMKIGGVTLDGVNVLLSRVSMPAPSPRRGRGRQIPSST
jgi:hypothetical protein